MESSFKAVRRPESNRVPCNWRLRHPEVQGPAVRLHSDVCPSMISVSEINAKNWEATLKRIVDERPSMIVPGHGNLGGPEIADQVRVYLEKVRQLVHSANIDTGALSQLEIQVKEQNPTWERREFIAPTIRYFAANPSA